MSDVERRPVVGPVDRRRVSAGHVLALCGFVLVAVGVALPWVGETGLRVYVLGMASGFERQWGKRLLAGAGLGTAVVLAGLAWGGRWRVVGPVLAAIGTVTVLVAVLTTPLTKQSPPPPDLGVYVTLVGGLLVVTAALLGLAGGRAPPVTDWARP